MRCFIIRSTDTDLLEPVHVEERVEPRLVVPLDGDPAPLLQHPAQVGRGQPGPVVQSQRALAEKIFASNMKNILPKYALTSRGLTILSLSGSPRPRGLKLSWLEFLLLSKESVKEPGRSLAPAPSPSTPYGRFRKYSSQPAIAPGESSPSDPRS